MLSEDDYESDYDTRPEVGRARQHPDSDDSDNEASSSVPTYRSRFPNGGGDDDEDRPIIVEETSVIVNPIRRPTAFSDPNSPISSGLTFHKTPIHSTVSANGTSMFCIEGYVNTPELSAGRGGGLSQGLPTDGPYKSLFRADWEARNKTAVITPDTTGLHILANAAQSPESPISPVSATSPDPDPDSAPAPATIKRRNPSPLVASPPTSSVALPESISAAQSSLEASSSANSSYVTTGPSHQQPYQAKSRAGNGNSKPKANTPSAIPSPHSSAQPRADDDPQYERPAFSHQHPGPLLPVTGPCGVKSVQSRFVKARKDKMRAKGVIPLPAPPRLANSNSYDRREGYYSSYYDAEPFGQGNDFIHEVSEEGQGPSLPPPKVWPSPRSSPSAMVLYPSSTHTTSKESSPSLVGSSPRSLTQSKKLRMLTLLIEDRRCGTDELAEIRVPLKAAGEGYFWADAKEVCMALQSGPSRVDGPAKLFTMRGKYRQTFLRISLGGEETCQSAHLNVNPDRTLPVVVDTLDLVLMPRFSSDPSPLISTGLITPVSNVAHPLTPMSNGLDHEDIPANPLNHKESEQWAGNVRKRKREMSLIHEQPLSGPQEGHNPRNPSEAPAQTIPTPHGHHSRSRKSRRGDLITSLDGGYMSDSPPAGHHWYKVQRKDQAPFGSRPHRVEYETDQPSSSVRARAPSGVMAVQEQYHSSGRRVHSPLQPLSTPFESAQRVNDKIISFLQGKFMQDISNWNEFVRDRALVGFLSNAVLLRVYWFAQGQVDDWVGTRTPEHLNYKTVEVKHVLVALGVTEGWYEECNETLSLAIAYGEHGERCEDPRAVAASRDCTPKTRTPSPGPTDLLVLLRQVHDEYCKRVTERDE